MEFHFLNNGFQFIDGHTEENSDFYSYHDLQSVELNSVWFPRLAQWLRVITWVLNGVPYFPDAESYKKASLIIHFRNTKLNIWLTNSYMAKQAKKLADLLAEKTTYNN